jgi:hypothetical protein
MHSRDASKRIVLTRKASEREGEGAMSVFNSCETRKQS